MFERVVQKFKQGFVWYMLAGLLIWVPRIVFEFDGRITPLTWLISIVFTAFLVFCLFTTFTGLFGISKSILRKLGKSSAPKILCLALVSLPYAWVLTLLTSPSL